MNAQTTLENIEESLQEHGQGHLLAFWDQLDADQRQGLFSQVRSLDLARIDRWVADYVKKATAVEIDHDLTAAESYGPHPVGAEQQGKYAKAVELGKEFISAGKVAAFVVAGGQGTRLGFDGPKGAFPISPVKNRTLFQVFADSIAEVSRRYQTVCPWYIMTSRLNYAETVDILRSNGHYGLDEKDVFIFQQGTLPNFAPDGRILLADKANISCSPDGHGGSLKALHQSGALADMKKRGVEYLSYFQVDNALINIFDPLFVGLHVLDGAEMSSKAVIKTGPKEKVGNFCLVDGKVSVIEYSDLPDELAQKRRSDGSLVFELGSIAIHIINSSFVERLSSRGFALPLHRAVKKIRHVDEQGKPTESEGIKLESFVFDALPLASNSMILQTLRNEEFAPTKNPTGVDSVETTRQMMVARAADWLEWAGVAVPRKPDGAPDCLLEIAPSFALEKEDLKGKLGEIPQISPDDSIYLA
ncbi:MAG: UTP--glucose-1-phosphate uridylyltransferase [Planctomycetota bacterium]|jgi:UDP-N-acetylglucosamine/UDP-N-acetylgalactosamine diphosphorylase